MRVLALALALVLGGCQASGSPTVPLDLSGLDARVANASAQLAQYCTWLRVATGIGAGFAKTDKHRLYVYRANTVVGLYCDAPPQDVVGAVKLLVQAYQNVTTVPAVAAAVQEVRI